MCHMNFHRRILPPGWPGWDDAPAVLPQAAVTNAHPQSLAVPKDTGDLPDDDSIGGWKHYLLRLGGFYSRESGLIRGERSAVEVLRCQAAV